jgi:hypothetical protein
MMRTGTIVGTAGCGREAAELQAWDKRQGAVSGRMLLSFDEEREKIRLGGSDRAVNTWALKVFTVSYSATSKNKKCLLLATQPHPKTKSVYC